MTNREWKCHQSLVQFLTRPSIHAVNLQFKSSNLHQICFVRLIFFISWAGYKTTLGLPEVMLGLLPGSGGTQRLPKLVGLPNSLDLSLTGKSLKPAKAKKMGLVDMLVAPLGSGLSPAEETTRNYLEDVAVHVAQDLANGKMKLPSRGKPKNLQEKVMMWAMKYDFIKVITYDIIKTLWPIGVSTYSFTSYLRQLVVRRVIDSKTYLPFQ